jgi:hypothetical protein
MIAGHKDATRVKSIAENTDAALGNLKNRI